MIEHDVTYKWSYGSQSVAATRAITSDNGGTLDLVVPAATPNLPAAFSLTLAKARSVFLLCDQAVALKAGGTDAAQQVSITGSPAGGTFTLTSGASTSAAIAYNATAAQVQTALRAMTSVGASGVSCSGGPLPGTPVDCAFKGPLAVQAVTLMTHTDSLTGGSSPAVSVATTTAGAGPDTTVNLLANVPLVWDGQGYFAQPFAADVATLRATNAGGVDANLKLRTLSSA